MKHIGMLKAMKLCWDYEKLTAAERRAIQERRLKELVKHARKSSPYYRTLYRNVPESFRLEDLPPVNKRELMANWDAWVADPSLTLEEAERFMSDKRNIGAKLRNRYLVFTTSGSTGNPLVAVCDPMTNNVMGAISACRSFARKEDLIAFLKRGARSIAVFADDGFYLGNTSIRSRLRSMPWKRRQLAVSSALYPADRIVRDLNAFQPAMVGGYPSNLELLIDEAEAGRLNISPVLIMTGGEYLSDSLRTRLADAFHCYVQTSYSCTEGGTVACECRCGKFHINDDWLIVEPIDEKGNPVRDGVQSDRILLTNLYNYTQPFIRYEVTDRVIFHHEPCPCGNPSPWIELEGRTDDVTVFREDGKTIRIAPLSVYAVLKEVPSLRRFQVLVHPENRIELRMEEAPGAKRSEVFETAKQRLQDYLRSQHITHALVILSEEMPKQDARSGKFRHVINAQKEF